LANEIRKLREEHGRRKIIVFELSPFHADLLSHALNGAGIRSASITSDTPRGARRAQVARFKKEDGGLDVLVNFEVLTTGFDAPMIDAVVMARPVASDLLYMQMVGRGLRGKEMRGKQDVIVLEVADKLAGAGSDGFHARLEDCRKLVRTTFPPPQSSTRTEQA
jgi:superfamily II DNA or RNA helicase